MRPGIVVILLFCLISCTYDQSSFFLRISGGRGEGLFSVGERVLIEALPAPEGQGFLYWEGDTSFVEDPQAPRTFVNMPPTEVVLEATFDELPTFRLIVKNGSGSGRYLQGTNVLISADSGLVDEIFDSWQGEIQLLDRADKATTYLQMPASDIEIEAIYKLWINIHEPITFNDHLKPVFQRSCIEGDCHTGANTITDLSTYEEIFKSRGDVQYVIETDFMPIPPKDPLTPLEKQAILNGSKMVHLKANLPILHSTQLHK